MNYDFNRQWLTKKFEEIRRRILLAIEQLDDRQVNWRPDDTSHSISTLVKHMDGNILERVLKGILNEDIQRNRDDEFRQTYLDKSIIENIIQQRFQLIIDTVNRISDDQWGETQIVRGKERTNLDMLHQCAAHYSEHMGQILYIAKHCLQQKYKSTSI